MPGPAPPPSLLPGLPLLCWQVLAPQAWVRFAYQPACTCDSGSPQQDAQERPLGSRAVPHDSPSKCQVGSSLGTGLGKQSSIAADATGSQGDNRPRLPAPGARSPGTSPWGLEASGTEPGRVQEEYQSLLGPLAWPSPITRDSRRACHQCSWPLSQSHFGSCGTDIPPVHPLDPRHP